MVSQTKIIQAKVLSGVIMIKTYIFKITEAFFSESFSEHDPIQGPAGKSPYRILLCETETKEDQIRTRKELPSCHEQKARIRQEVEAIAKPFKFLDTFYKIYTI